MKEKFLPNQKYYNFSTQCQCGVVVDERTMRRIQKVLYKAEAEIKNILHNADNVRSCDWSLVNVMDGEKIKKQKVFHYPSFRDYDTAEERIDYLKLTTPRYLEDFYEIHNDEELSELKSCLLKELQEGINCHRVKEQEVEE